jgi:predicted helicase
MAERLGIVYTPVEVVDFIIRSVEDVLRDEFESGLAEEEVHIIDPFTGTGTFLVRLLQSGLIPPEKLLHKYQHELHANEIVLLAYYIAAINIEETFHGLHASKGKDEYLPFDGICLTDTFQLYESDQKQIEGTFIENTARVKRQKASPIRVVIANPPYSMGQVSENDNNQNLDYSALDARIGETYVKRSTATLKTSLYDSYIRAIRWASDRIDNKGVVGFVTNGYFIDGNAADGLRASLTDEFTSIYIFNLRGNQRTSGEVSRQEGGKIFGSGARTPVAITLLVKNPEKVPPATLRYHDIGDYLSRDEKLEIIRGFVSIAKIESQKKWTTLTPNAEHDWINQRDIAYASFLELSGGVFSDSFGGVKTNRDAWCYNFSTKNLAENMGAMIRAYERQRKKFNESISGNLDERKRAVEDFIDNDPKLIAWTVNLKLDLARDRKHTLNDDARVVSLYRPFTRMNWYSDRSLNERPLGGRIMFPTPIRMSSYACQVPERETNSPHLQRTPFPICRSQIKAPAVSAFRFTSMKRPTNHPACNSTSQRLSTAIIVGTRLRMGF